MWETVAWSPWSRHFLAVSIAPFIAFFFLTWRVCWNPPSFFSLNISLIYRSICCTHTGPCTHLHELKLRCSSVSNGGTRALMDLLIEGKPDIVLPALKEVRLESSSGVIRRGLGLDFWHNIGWVMIYLATVRLTLLPLYALKHTTQVDVRDSDIVNSEKLRRLKARLARARPCVSIHYY